MFIRALVWEVLDISVAEVAAAEIGQQRKLPTHRSPIFDEGSDPVRKIDFQSALIRLLSSQ
jgi:hypothetical protein